MWAAVWLAQAAVPEGGLLTLALGSSLGVWAMLATFALIGSLLRTHRLDFAIPGEIETDEEHRARLQREDWRKTLDLAYASIRSGLVEQGYWWSSGGVLMAAAAGAIGGGVAGFVGYSFSVFSDWYVVNYGSGS